MPDLSFDKIDAGRSFDWGQTSADYDRYRPGPPQSFYRKLAALDVGLAGQSVLDMGTGTGLLARRFASQGAAVCGTDISPDQIAMAQSAAQREDHNIDFQTAAAEAQPFGDNSFDVVTANQCWIYFDLKQVIPEVIRVLRPRGLLVVSHFSFMPRLDPIVAASEALVLQYNPDWNGADWDGTIAPDPKWARPDLELVGWFVYDEPIAFTRESWRGRMRALRGIAASLSADEVTRFDAEHESLLKTLAGEKFDILHRIHAQIFRPVLAN